MRTSIAPVSVLPATSRFARRPASLREAFLWALPLAACLRAFSFGTTGLDWDESFYIVIARRWLHGGVPYADIWDIHPMGVPALFTLGTWIVGDGLLAARLLALIAVAGTAAMLWVCLDKYTRLKPAGILAGLFYLAYMARPEGLAANTEIFNNLAITWAFYLLAGQSMTPARTVRPTTMFAASLSLGIGLQFKYVVFPEAVALCGTALLWQLREGASVWRTARLAVIAIAGGLLPTLVASVYYWWAGAFHPYLDATLRANVAYVSEPLDVDIIVARLRYGLVPISGLLVWPAVLYLLRGHGRLGRRQKILCAWLAIWLVAACVDVAMPLKFWKHYFNALVPPLCAIAGLTLVLLARERPAGFARLISIGAILTLVPAGVEIARHIDDSRTINRTNVPWRIADRIKAVGTNGHDVYVLNYDPLVYAYTKAVPPSRFVLGIELSDFSASAGTSAENEIGRILGEKPRWIVEAQPSPYMYTDRVKRELEGALRNYQLDSTFQETDYIQPPIEVLLYRRRADGDH